MVSVVNTGTDVSLEVLPDGVGVIRLKELRYPCSDYIFQFYVGEGINKSDQWILLIDGDIDASGFGAIIRYGIHIANSGKTLVVVSKAYSVKRIFGIFAQKEAYLPELFDDIIAARDYLSLN